MTSRYDRTIEDVERARLNPETAMGQQYGVGAVAGYSEPFWAAQARAGVPFPTQPLYGGQIPLPYSAAGPTMFQPPVAGQQLGSMQGLPASVPGMQGHVPPAYAQFAQPPIHPWLALQQNPYFYSTPIPMHLFGPTFAPGFAFQPFPQQTQFLTQGEWPGQFPGWENIPQRGPFLRQPSRAFYRAPRAYRRSDDLIRDEICKRLALTPEIDVTDVDVMVKDGEVTLKGLVDDRIAKRIVEEITEVTFGVRDVLNDLKIGSRVTDQEQYSPTKGKEK
jgi:hypothetical protein